MSRRQCLVVAAMTAGVLAVVSAQAPVRFDGGAGVRTPPPDGGLRPQAGRIRGPGCDACRYIVSELAAAGLKTSEQAFDANTPIGPLKMVNLIATIPGIRPDRVVFGGHYETKLFREFRFIGANDGGSSAAFLIEVGRVLKAREPDDGRDRVLRRRGGHTPELGPGRQHLRQPPLRRCREEGGRAGRGPRPRPRGYDWRSRPRHRARRGINDLA